VLYIQLKQLNIKNIKKYIYGGVARFGPMWPATPIFTNRGCWPSPFWLMGWADHTQAQSGMAELLPRALGVE
jgi:lipopolysaccharide biosynthesis protein